MVAIKDDPQRSMFGRLFPASISDNYETKISNIIDEKTSSYGFVASPLYQSAFRTNKIRNITPIRHTVSNFVDKYNKLPAGDIRSIITVNFQDEDGNELYDSSILRSNLG